MTDEKLKRMAVARLRGFRSHVHAPITVTMLNEYHSILYLLEDAYEEDLQNFAISPVNVVPQLIPDHLISRYRLRGVPQFTQERYCDQELFKSTIEALWDRIDRRGVGAK
jgi:hypothetical protein